MLRLRLKEIFRLFVVKQESCTRVCVCVCLYSMGGVLPVGAWLDPASQIIVLCEQNLSAAPAELQINLIPHQ